MTTSLAMPARRASLAVSLVVLCLAAAAPVVRASDEVDAPPDITISIGAALSDRAITVDAGDVIEFVNRDGERHRMRARTEPEGFDTGNLESGESYRFVLTVAGTYPYIDERNDDHTAYHGRIVVRAPATGSPDAEAVTVRIGDEVFSPAAVTVAVGGQVTFENLDGDDHTATSTDGGPLASPVLATGESYAATFPESGTFSYLCAIHPEMTGTVEVVGEATAVPPGPAAPAAPAAPDVPLTPEAPGTAPDAGGTGAGSGPAVDIEMQDFAFAMADVEVQAGTTVTWTNTGAAPHTATADDSTFDTTLVAAGARASHTFTTPGTYSYLCMFHPGMTGTIRVVGEAGASGGTSPAAPASSSGGVENAPVESATPAGESVPPTVAEVDAGTLESDGEPIEPAAPAAIDPAPASSASVDNLARLALVLLIVTVAGALFARTIQGTVRAPE